MCATRAGINSIATPPYESNRSYHETAPPASRTEQRICRRAAVQDPAARAGILVTGVPGEAEGKPPQDIKRLWGGVRTKAGLPGVRIHDLRHTSGRCSRQAA